MTSKKFFVVLLFYYFYFVDIGSANKWCETKSGSVVIAGTGISVGQITRETVGYIENADVVLYLISDRATEKYVRSLNENWKDLSVYYAEKKSRRDVYDEILLEIMQNVRDSKDVVALFYGHPGIFTNAAHEILDKCKEEGYSAKMIPGISAVDCLFSDLHIDVCPGLIQYEATDFLLRKRVLVPTLHTVIWQIGSVGNVGFSSDYENEYLYLLEEKLVEVYGRDYEVIHYIAATYPTLEPIIEKFPLSTLSQHKTSTASTLYIPPMADGNDIDQTLANKMHLTVRNNYFETTKEETYISPKYVSYNESSRLGDYLINIATNPQLQHDHKNNPMDTMKSYGLNIIEQYALLSQNVGMIKFAIDGDAIKGEEDDLYLLENNQRLNVETKNFSFYSRLVSHFSLLPEVQLVATD